MAEGDAPADKLISYIVVHVLMEGQEPCAVFLLGPSGHVETWGPGAERLLGYSKEDVIGDHFSLFFFRPEEVARGEPDRELQAARQLGWTVVERWYSRKDGLAFWGSGITAVVQDESGQVHGFAKVLRDHTGQKLLEW
jgi:PAS domain S-box-containing protein